VTRKLEITISLGGGSIRERVTLPEGWDEMTEDERQTSIDDEAETIIWNRKHVTGLVVEVPER
jgi:hypothetical protein